MFKNFKKSYERRKRAKNVCIEELFGDKVEKVPSENKGVKFKAVKITSFILTSSLIGVLLSTPAVLALSAGVEVAKPIVKTWKEAPIELPEIGIAQKNIFLDRNGKPFAEIFAQDREVLSSLEKVSDNAVKALIATEDKRFYEHKGVDAQGTLRAFIKGGGGSGITQQLIKNLQYYNLEKDLKDSATEATLERKIKELKLALEYEEKHSKEEILLNYFNTVAFGGPNVYSIQSASKRFFNKNASDLNLSEASLLIGTVQNPTIYDLDNPDKLNKARERQEHVLSRMVAEGFIKEADKQEVMNSPIEFKRNKPLSGTCYSSSDPFYCDYTLKKLKEDERLGGTQEERDKRISLGGIVVETYLDPELSDLAKKQVEADYGKNNRIVAPIVVAENGTGGIRAIAFNRDYGEGEGKTLINIPLHKSSTGSVFKIFTLGASLRSGFEEKDLVFGSRCPLIDPRIDYPLGGFTNSSGCGYQNAPNMDYKRAIAISSNTWFVELLLKVGIEDVKKFAGEIGLEPDEKINSRSASYTLGVTEHAPVDVASATAMFHNGIYCPATPIKRLREGDKELVPAETYNEKEHSCRRVLSEKDANTVKKAMIANLSPGGFGFERRVSGAVVGGKSGTNGTISQAFDMLITTGKGEKLAIYGNSYDMDNTASGEGIEYVVHRGVLKNWILNPASQTVGDYAKKVLELRGKGNLDISSLDDSLPEVEPLESKRYLKMPNLIGMDSNKAVSILKNYGIFEVKVLKDFTTEAPDNIQRGTVAVQSPSPGEKIAYEAYGDGKRKEVIIQLKE